MKAQKKKVRLEESEKHQDNKDKLLVTVRRMKNTPEGFMELEMYSYEWRSESAKADKQLLKLATHLKKLKFIARAKLVRL